MAKNPHTPTRVAASEGGKYSLAPDFSSPVRRTTVNTLSTLTPVIWFVNPKNIAIPVEYLDAGLVSTSI